MSIFTFFSSASSSSKDSSTSIPRRHPSRLSSSLVKSALGVALAMGVVAGGQAQALTIRLLGGGSTRWEVTTFEGSYDANIELFNTPENDGVMPWTYVPREAPLSAYNFANQVKESLGMPNINGSVGPLFFWRLPAYGGDACAWTSSGNHTTTICKKELFDWGFDTSSDNVVWAQAVRTRGRSGGPGPGLDPDEVPSPLPALGAAAAFGFSRKLRKRIKSNANPVPTTHSS